MFIVPLFSIVYCLFILSYLGYLATTVFSFAPFDRLGVGGSDLIWPASFDRLRIIFARPLFGALHSWNSQISPNNRLGDAMLAATTP
jgi:hypothetical protein